MVLGWIVNIGRSIPFIILMVALIPFTKFVVGKSIGSTAAIVPLVIAAAPFIARLVETSLQELDAGVIEAAKAMGASNWQIVYKVMLPESFPLWCGELTIALITLIRLFRQWRVPSAEAVWEILPFVMDTIDIRTTL